MKKFLVEDLVFGMIVMENGVIIMLEFSWVLNLLDVDEVKCSFSGMEVGVDMKNGLCINGEKFSCFYMNEIFFSVDGVVFYDGKLESVLDVEMRKWIEVIDKD